MACTHRIPLAIPSVDVAQIYFYTEQPELMLFTLVTYIFFLCVPFLFIRFIKQAPTLPQENITQDGPLRNVALKENLDKEMCFKGRDDTENQRVNDEFCIRKKRRRVATDGLDPNEEGHLPFLWCYVETASLDKNLLRH